MKKNVREPFCTVKTNTKLMSAFWQQNIFRTKIDEYRMFFGSSILGGFWKGFGTVSGGRNPRFSYFFRHFFGLNFKGFFGRPKSDQK